jgi:hypothetical protein
MSDLLTAVLEEAAPFDFPNYQQTLAAWAKSPAYQALATRLSEVDRLAILGSGHVAWAGEVRRRLLERLLDECMTGGPESLTTPEIADYLVNQDFSLLAASELFNGLVADNLKISSTQIEIVYRQTQAAIETLIRSAWPGFWRGELPGLVFDDLYHPSLEAIYIFEDDAITIHLGDLIRARALRAGTLHRGEAVWDLCPQMTLGWHTPVQTILHELSHAATARRRGVVGQIIPTDDRLFLLDEALAEAEGILAVPSQIPAILRPESVLTDLPYTDCAERLTALGRKDLVALISDPDRVAAQSYPALTAWLAIKDTEPVEGYRSLAQIL